MKPDCSQSCLPLNLDQFKLKIQNYGSRFHGKASEMVNKIDLFYIFYTESVNYT